MVNMGTQNNGVLAQQQAVPHETSGAYIYAVSVDEVVRNVVTTAYSYKTSESSSVASSTATA
jgi:hypothetical protein